MLLTPEPINYNDEIVPSQLRHRIGKSGAFSRVHNTRPFFEFLQDIPSAGCQKDDSNQVAVRRIHNKPRESLPDALRKEFSAADLSRKFCTDLFERMGYVFELQEGPAEAGSDLVIIVDDPFLPESVEIRIGAQVFAYEETVNEALLRRKLEQLLQG